MAEEPKSLVKNPADPDQVKKATRDENLKKKIEVKEMTDLLDMEIGRRVLWRILGFCRLHETSFTRACGITMAFNEGQRDIGLKILNAIREAGEDYLAEMMLDNKK